MTGSGKVVLRIGATLRDALYVVMVAADKTMTTPLQSSATRFETSDEARAVVVGMLARGDSWADRVRPSRLVGTRTIQRTRTMGAT